MYIIIDMYVLCTVPCFGLALLGWTVLVNIKSHLYLLLWVSIAIIGSYIHYVMIGLIIR